MAPRLSALFAVAFAISLSARTLPRRALLGAALVDNDGVRISAIRAGSAADRGGLKTGDVILSVGADAIANTSAAVARVKAGPAGVPIAFRIRRGDDTLSLPITLEAAPQEHDPLVDTIYDSVDVDGSLRRTLFTVPKSASGRVPAVLLLGGIGCYSIDNATDAHDEYMHLAHDLGRAGIAVMRLEKSGVGDSEGQPCITVDFNAEMHSYAIALDALRNEWHVDANRVYLFGHSIGTLIAPRIANKSAVAGIIAADGVGRNWFEYELWNLRRQLQLGGESPADIDAKLATKELCMHRFLIEKQDTPACKEQNTYPAAAAYMQQVAALNIAEPWTKLAVPTLVIYGTSDFITTLRDHERIVAIINAAHPHTATLKLISGMDHHFDEAASPQEAYDLRVKKQTRGPYVEQLSKTVIAWIQSR